jgi:uncharacterized repeat protein (TIGR01451 family)
MAFNPPSIPLNGTSTLTISLFNPETSDTDLVGVSLTDTLPAGLTVANGSASVCFGDAGTLTTSGGNTIAFTLPTLYVGWGCSFDVVVSGPGVAGGYTNTAGPIVSTGGIPGNSASATLYVLAPPTIGMAFHPATIEVGAQSSLTFTLTNNAANGADITGAGVAATLPAGLAVADGTLSGCGGIVTTSGGNTISLSGGTIPVASDCTFSVNVTGAAIGGYTTASGAISSANAGTGGSATAGLVVTAKAATPPADPSPTSAVAGATATSAAVTAPPTSTDGSDTPGKSDSMPLLALMLAFVAVVIAVRRAELRAGHMDLR